VSLCHNSLVNCTQRDFVPSPSPSPSSSPSPSVAPDCVLCGHLLENLALLCMNQEIVNQRTTYETCMTQTSTREYFEHCVTFLGEVVDLAGSRDPCTMLQCEQPQVTCAMVPTGGCHVTRYNASSHSRPSFSLNTTTAQSEYARTQGLGPGDFRPGQKPYNSDLPLVPRITPQDRVAGGDFTPLTPSEPTTPEGIANKERQQAAAADSANDNLTNLPISAPVPLKDIKLQL